MGSHCLLRILPANIEVLSSRIAIWTWLFRLLKALMFIFSQSEWQEETGRCWRSNLRGDSLQVGFWAVMPGWVSGDAPATPTTAAIRTAVSENFWAGTHETWMLLPAPGLIWMNNYFTKVTDGVYWASAVVKGSTDRCGIQAASLPSGSS